MMGFDYPVFVWARANVDEVGTVNLSDYAIVGLRWLEDCSGGDDCGGADVDFSGRVDVGDMALLCDWWLGGM